MMEKYPLRGTNKNGKSIALNTLVGSNKNQARSSSSTDLNYQSVSKKVTFTISIRFQLNGKEKRRLDVNRSTGFIYNIDSTFT